MLPYFGIEFVLATCFKAINDMHFVVSISTLMLSAAIYYCLRNVIKLRFFNSFPQVQGSQSPYVINQFKAVLEQLNEATSSQELIHITQAFFKEAFAIPPRAVQLIIRQPHTHPEQSSPPLEQHIEQFLSEHESLLNPLYESTIDLLVLDEIAFNNFYFNVEKNALFIRFLHKISADLFLPIYSNRRIVGSIVIAAHERTQCFSHSEQDAMVAFASYLGNIINLLLQKDHESILYRKKKLKDVIFTTHQEINHYKESIHAFLRQSQKKTLGIIFYKNGHFSMANDDAQRLITMDPNAHTGDPLNRALLQVAHHVDTFKTPYSHSVKNEKGQTILLSGVPHIQQSHTIITVSYPDVADVIMNQMHLLHDPHDWDYLLYLSSTQSCNLSSRSKPIG